MSYKIPSGETVCVRYADMNGEELFFMTTKQSTELFYLYEIDGDTVSKIGKAQSPFELESRFNVIEKISGNTQ